MASSSLNLNNSVAQSVKQSQNIATKAAEVSNAMDLDQLQHMINCTVKKNPKAELSKSDLLRLLGYLEGELQARDVVIATLKAERVKQLVAHARYGKVLPLNDPFVALQRDSRSTTSGTSAADEAAIVKTVTDGPINALEALVAQHRNSNVKLIQTMQEAEARHLAEIEIEKQARKKMEKEINKLQETLDEERKRQKRIVLLLLAERKKLILKYVDERNKAEDLAQILGEEKGRVDSMAEGLEEESQKALQMEAELEKQLAMFDGERAQLKAQLVKEEKRTKELDMLVEKLQTEVENLKKQQAEAHQVAMFQAGLNQPSSPPRISTLPNSRSNATTAPIMSATLGPQIPAKPNMIPPQTPPRAVNANISTSPVSIPRVNASPSVGMALNSAAGHVVMGTSGKAVQPMAVVNSTPVQAPTTGIARAVSPASGGVRNIHYTLGSMTTPGAQGISPSLGIPGSSRTLPPSPMTGSSSASSPEAGDLSTIGRQAANQNVAPSPRVAVSASAGSKVFTTTNNDGKVTFHVTTSATLPSNASSAGVASSIQISSATQPPTPKKSTMTGRGVPPPVPPNKPVIPPKKTSGVSAGVAPNSSAGTNTLTAVSPGSGPEENTNGVILHMGV